MRLNQKQQKIYNHLKILIQCRIDLKQYTTILTINEFLSELQTHHNLPDNIAEKLFKHFYRYSKKYGLRKP